MVKTIRSVVRAISRLVALVLVVPAFRLLEMLVPVRITPVTTMRIGGLTIINHFYAAGRKLGMHDEGARRIFVGAVPCNRQLLDMWKRVMPIVESRPLWAFYQYASDILERIPTFRPLPNDKGAGHLTNTNFLVTQSRDVLSFNAADEARGRRLLERMGIGPDDWFVCFHARDSVYQSMLEQRDDTKSHRNAPLASYLEAAQYIADKGGFAIRVGQMVESPLPETGNPRIIDYSTKFWSDFGDIYLPGKCLFFLASASGYQQVPVLFGRPVATAHLLPLIPNQTGTHSLYIPKLFRHKHTGSYLTYGECFAAMGDPKDYPTTAWDSFEMNETDTYRPENNSATDVLDLCIDMFDQLEGRPPDSDAAAVQQLYMDKFFRNNADFHQYGPRLGPRFARKYRRLIEDANIAPLDRAILVG
jgi:putative glycosyltransferase (TIGR04372 family)